MVNIAFYGSHNGSYAIERDGEILAVVEIERLLGVKNCGISQYKTPRQELILYLAEYIPKFLMSKFSITEFDNCYHQNTELAMDNEHYRLASYIPAKSYHSKLHHESHAAGAFYQTDYMDALIFSFDGGGNDGMFNIYVANRSTGVREIRRVYNPVFNMPHVYYNLGFPYMIFGQYMGDITLESLSDGNLVYPGKLMGLASYGNVKMEWVPYFKQFYKNNPEGHNYMHLIALLESHINQHNQRSGLPPVHFNIESRFTGQLAYDIAATSQHVFEECFMEIAKPVIEEYPELPIGITGGCALNILLNTRIATEFNRDVFVGPNPSDCGLAVGMLLSEIKPKYKVDLTYSGMELLDSDMIFSYLSENRTVMIPKTVNIDDIAHDLTNGKIIGVARGRSEHGPRALGNRSILCNPSIESMKDTLNEKVKHREWYRPFAPVVRLEDVSIYFEWEGESQWMSFCPKVRPEYVDKLSAITHVDGTARVQTVTREQNEWLYDLLTRFAELNGIGVLLNTSFNVNGKPILTSAREAFEVFYSSAMDGLVVEDMYVTKK